MTEVKFLRISGTYIIPDFLYKVEWFGKGKFCAGRA